MIRFMSGYTPSRKAVELPRPLREDRVGRGSLLGSEIQLLRHVPQRRVLPLGDVPQCLPRSRHPAASAERAVEMVTIEHDSSENPTRNVTKRTTTETIRADVPRLAGLVMIRHGSVPPITDSASQPGSLGPTMSPTASCS